MYSDFLTRTSNALASVGAIPLLSPDQIPASPDGLIGWDQILLADVPGQSTLFAFTRAPAALTVLQERVDALTGRLATMNFFRGQPINLLFIVASDNAADERTRRAMAKVVPAAYYAGLRPSVWVADLDSHGFIRGTRGGAIPGADALEEAIRSPVSVGGLDVIQAGVVRDRQTERSRAFYELMQGRQPIVTYGLVLVNVVVYLVELANGGPDNGNTLINMGALVPRLVLDGQWWRLFTVMFLHASIAHILFNMVSLVVVGTITERLYGSRRFLAIYLGAGLLGGVASLLHGMATNDLNTPAVGASGAIFGIVGALLTLRFQGSEVIPAYLRNRISSSMVPIVVLNLLLGVATAHIDNFAHLGGLVGGAALSFVFPLTKTVSGLATVSDAHLSIPTSAQTDEVRDRYKIEP